VIGDDLFTAAAGVELLDPGDPEGALRRLFGFDGFRPGQREAVEAALAGRDALVVMPTGAGKSLCYQLPALVRDDLTLVVSPLVSLMQDQVEGLAAVAGSRVGLVNAQRSAAENRATLAAAARGELRLLYVAPERFSSRPFLDAVRDARVGLFVVDEAHCVSQWGHDFRPDYFRLADAARWLGARAIMGATATATPQVATDVERRLGLRDPVRVATGFDRPNLSFAVVRCASKRAKRRHLAAVLGDPATRPAIVYAGTRAATEEVAALLRAELGCEVAAYHAGLDREQRAAVQRRFMAGGDGVVVATNAFGMGVDKADVRTVCHDAVPSSVEAWYQEAGRAGRDGAPARALLFAEGRDKGLHVFFIQRAEVDDGLVRRVAQRLAQRAEGGRYDVGLDELASLAGEGQGGDDQVRAVVGHLARAGVVRPAPSTPDRVRGAVEGPFDGRARAACRASAGEAQRARWRQYRSVWALVEGDGCRRRELLRHFGDDAAPAPMAGVPCCDACDPALVQPAPAGGAQQHGGGGERPGSGAPRGVRPVGGDLDSAIVAIVRSARPKVGRTRTVEILRGSQAKLIRENAYDGLPGYGTFDHLTAAEVLVRVDELIVAGRLRSTGGAFPKLEAA
jgi:ATP-dependent DNA helicase RecQ